MSDLIDRAKALHALVTIDTTRYCVPCREVLMAIKNMPSAEPQERKTEKALRLLLEWAIECDFGYDNIPEEYEKYKDEIQDMGYTEGLIYIAEREVEHEAD